MILLRRGLAVPALLAGLAFASVPGRAAQGVATAKGLPSAAAARIPNTLGSPDAPVSIVVFTDLECPFSAATFPIVQQLVEADPTRVHLTVKQFPLPIHPDAGLAAEAVEAAGAQGKFFAMTDLIQANQKQMSRSQYLHYAQFLHLNLAAFSRDLDEHRFHAQVQADIDEGVALGVRATPTLLINGRTFTGSQDAATLIGAIRAGLDEAAKNDSARAAVVAPSLPPVDMAALARDPVAERGPANAPVTIVEFTDFECPFCRRSSEPIGQLLEQNPAQVRFIFRNFPLDIHDHAEQAAEAALAAGAQGKFWPMHDLLFAHQKDLSRQALIGLAEQLHLDVARFTNDLDTGKYKSEIAADRALGVQANVNGTPAFFVNGRRIDGALTLPELEQAVALANADPHGAQAVASSSESGPRRTSVLIAGPRNAPVTLTWFSDIQTSSAARMGQLVRQLAGVSAEASAASSASGVRVIFKYYAVPGHTAAPFAHLALVEAAAEGRFWPLYDTLTALHFTGNTAADRAAILSAAKLAGLDVPRVQGAISAGLDAADLRDDTSEAEWRGIRGAPTLFINQVRVDGLQSPKLYAAYIRKALAEDTSSGN
jgi:protein-disulfide isomerase